MTERWKQYVPLLLRIALGAIFIVHGWDKLSGDMSQTAAFFGKIGIPVPGFSAWLVAFVEFFGGIAVLTGLFTRIAAALIAIVMVVAMISVKFSQGFLGGWEFDFALFMIAVSLVISGDGEVALGQLFGKKAE